ncbi:MAG: short chain dehydrogenase [Bacteroidetes bacterium]|nr:MAG: short chain dehydrogenase [Bacteroidota bacterium]REK00038.1 MAG: short chain dehydrogenase [Bacteroidota bacterium]REK35781.1 MAG: short chain dehydrogenase [Bacteroidota bacterium]REK49346.1 MAG: short chain dehydrogenase [Bacteroidota bacterium]
MKDKVVIITGAGSGIGRALAVEFASKGSSVVISGRDIVALEDTEKLLAPFNVKVLQFQADISKEEDCRKLIEATLSHYSRLDVLINNAGISMRALFEETDLEVLRKIMNTNFWGAVYCTKYALPHLLKQKGSVVGVSSIAGKKGLPGRTGYSASKFALEGFLETLRTENLKKGLHVLVACPGFTATNIRSTSMNKEGKAQKESPRDESRMMSAAQVAAHIYEAVQKRKRDIVLTGNGKLTVWLNKFFPSLMDKLVYNHMAKEPDSPFK